MAFFLPQTFYHIQAPQNPLYHLLRELDQSVQQPQQPQRKRQCQPQQKSRAQASCPAYRVNSRPWEPRFEAHETEDSFVLYGELPGMNKEHVTVEFPEPRKLVVSGKVERFTESPKAAETTTEQTAPSPVIEPDNEDTRSRSSYQATVEDDVDDDEFEVLSHTSEKSKTMSQPEPETLNEKAQEKQPEQPEQPEEPRRSGYSKEFSRYFTFPTYINHDAVTADLKDGLLTIVVPKATPKSQRIMIN
ncbi:related to heat shock protein 30 [Fusarium oxysporum]|uniref:Related to heat shock protein 30 n=1 Tax=Fusarium oxysporum TaxID=5507 RepID=A0A2H3TJJ9_FUSOX|nr:related to heat shock protein 30 [Fusarium oxysporum]